jgi:hypothetical protein
MYDLYGRIVRGCGGKYRPTNAGQVCKAVLDLIQTAHILETGTESYRFRGTMDKLTKGEKPPDRK